MALTERERELLEKTVEQTQRVFDDCLQKSMITGDSFTWSDDLAQCEIIMKAIKHVLGGG